jgi:hypothetical protein
MVQELLQDQWDQVYAALGIPMGQDCKSSFQLVVQADRLAPMHQ